MNRCILSLVVILTVGVSGWSQTVTVAAAANISAVEAPLKDAFAHSHPGMTLQFTFGASGALVTQITQGAPIEVFLSADRGFAQRLVDAGLATGPVTTYSVGKLIFLAIKPIDLSQGIDVLLDPAVVQYANCNPETAPYGRAATDAMIKAGIYERVKAKQVTAQTITQAVQYTLTATSFGFINKSALYSKDVQRYNHEGKFWFEVDPKLYPPIEQGFVVMKSAQTLPEVQAFAAFLLSPEAQKVFAAYGYGKP